MDSIRLAIALGPVAAYGLALGLIHLAGRPLLTSGTREVYAVGLAVAGLIIVGPLSLFMPDVLAERMGVSTMSSIAVWGFMIVGYQLTLTLLALLARPRLVIYNIPPDTSITMLDELLVREDIEHYWAGPCLSIPPLGVHLQLERVASWGGVSLVATSGSQSHQGWRALERLIQAELQRGEATPCRSSNLFLLGSAAMLLLIGILLVREDPQSVYAALVEVLRP